MCASVVASPAWSQTVPTFTSTPVTTANEDEIYTYSVTTRDLDNNRLTLTATVRPGWLQLNPPSAMGMGAANAILTGTPTQANVGIHNVTLRVTDGTTPVTQSFQITVANINDPPVITGQTSPLTTAEETPLPLNLFNTNLIVSDPDNTYPIGFGLTVLAGANYSRSGPGNRTITPVTEFSGTLSVRVRVNDGSANSNIFGLQVNVTSVNDLPQFTSTGITTATEDVVYSYNVTATDSDSNDTLTLSATTLPSWLSLNPSGAMGMGSVSATLTGTPTQENGSPPSHNVTLRVTDGTTPVTQSFQITVAIVNDPPVITGQTNPLTTDEETPLTLTLANSNLTVTDPDNSYPADFTLIVRAGPNYSRSGPGNRTITPVTDFSGTLSVRVQVNDGAVSSNIFNLRVNVASVNDRPVIGGQNPSPLPTPEDTSIQITAAVLNVSDPDPGDTFMVVNSDTPGDNYTRVGTTIRPADDFNGTITVPVQVRDNGTMPGPLTSAPFDLRINVTPVNDAPELADPVAGIPDQMAIEATEFELALSQFFTDVDIDDSLNFQAIGFPDPLILSPPPYCLFPAPPPPASFVVSSNQGLISALSPQCWDAQDVPYTISVSATDEAGAFVETEFQLVVAALDRSDLSVVVAVEPDPALIGTAVDWTFSLSNSGPQESGPVELTAAFVGNLFSFTVPPDCLVTPEVERQVVSCSVSTVPVGSTELLMLSGQAAQAGDVLTLANTNVPGTVPIDPFAENNDDMAALNVAERLSDGPAQAIVSGNSQAAVAGDLNGDGFMELVIATGAGRSTEIYPNEVDPTNENKHGLASTAIALGDSVPSLGIVVADVDSDGDLDLITANGGGQANEVFLNDGGPMMMMSSAGRLGNETSRGVAAADFDGDTFVDLAFANGSPNTVYLNQGDGTFPVSASLFLGDADSYAVLAEDFDGDLIPDLVFANGDGPSVLYIGPNFGTSVEIEANPTTSVASGDFNGDGRPDLVFGRADGPGVPRNPVYMNLGGTFEKVADLGASPTVDVLTAAIAIDNSETFIDIITINDTGTHQIYLNNGNGSDFTPHPEQFQSTGATAGAIGDFNGDESGHPDLAISGLTGNNVFLNDGLGNLGPGDNVLPTIQLNGASSVILEVQDVYVDPGATATDDIDGDLTDRIVVANPVNTALVGSFVVTYDVFDKSGNRAVTVTRTVNVDAVQAQGGGGGGAVGGAVLVLLILSLYLRAVRYYSLCLTIFTPY